MIDGYTRLQAFRKVVLPQAATGIAATAIFCLIFSWNEYAFAVLLTSGRAQTISALNGSRVAHTGLPGEITVLHSRGRRVAFVGFAPYASDANLLDIPGAQALVRRARRRASLVVVIIHAGAEGTSALHIPHGSEFFLGENRGNPRAFAHAMIDAARRWWWAPGRT